LLYQISVSDKKEVVAHSRPGWARVNSIELFIFLY